MLFVVFYVTINNPLTVSLLTSNQDKNSIKKVMLEMLQKHVEAFVCKISLERIKKSHYNTL